MKRLAVILSMMLLSAFSGAQSSDIRVDCTQWDFGTVSNDAGTVFHTFEITNSSTEDFRIGGLATSCSCVNAYIGRVSIKAGETVKLPGGTVSGIDTKSWELKVAKTALTAAQRDREAGSQREGRRIRAEGVLRDALRLQREESRKNYTENQPRGLITYNTYL